MQCPKCKKEIPDKSLKCSFCNAKVASICKDCKTYNLITANTCSGCGKVLLRICSECGSANLPEASSCRRCKIPFVNEQPLVKDIKEEYQSSINSQQKIKAKLIEGIKDLNTKIITVSGESGSGKNLILRSAINELKSAKLIWLVGKCTQNTQISPFGYFQDILLAFFNINNFCPDTLQLKKNSLKFFKQDFPSLTNNEVFDLLNFLYPENIDRYENIYYNKAKMFSIMKKVFITIVEKTKIIFVIDSFENIDGMSFDFIKELIEDSQILARCKFIILTNASKPGLGMLASSNLNQENYLDLSIAPFNKNQIETFLKQYKDFNYGKDFCNLAMKLSAGNPSVIEQLVLLTNDAKRNNLKNINYSSFEDIVANRILLLKKEDVSAYRLLIAMSILGSKFYPAILENFDNISSLEFEQIIDTLVNKGFITQLNSLSFEFKTFDIWKIIVAKCKSDEQFEEILNILMETLSIYKQSSLALYAYLAQKLNNNDKAFDIWTLIMKQASYIGDIGLYIIAQKQALKLIENKTSDFYINVKKNIYTRVGKLLESIDFNLAFDYLQKALALLKEEDTFEYIDILAYLASCSMKSGNYCGVIECVENVLNKIPEEMTFERVLIKSRLIKPLLKLGNYGQLINTLETEIFNEIERVLKKGKNTTLIPLPDLFEIWIDLYFDFAEALIMQGDSRSTSVIQNIYEIIEKNCNNNSTLLCKTNLLLALMNTIKGDIKISNKILDDILKDYTLDNMDSFIVSRWNFIDILNKFFLKDYNTLHTELFNVVAYANNVNDSFTKNILKTLLAKILKDNNQTQKALEILEEQVSYFAQEKVATGVLLSWYLIAEIRLITSGTQFALDIASKALDIAQGPNINNYYFIALFNKLISEIYLAKQDFESSKVYLEKAIFIAKQFDLQYLLIKSYLQGAKLYQELALPKTSARGNYIKLALKMFQNAKNVSIVAEQPALQKRIKEDLNILTSFCKLNGIILKKESK